MSQVPRPRSAREAASQYSSFDDPEVDRPTEDDSGFRALSARFGSNKGEVVEARAVIEPRGAFATVGGVTASVAAEASARASADGVLASSITTVEADLTADIAASVVESISVSISGPTSNRTYKQSGAPTSPNLIPDHENIGAWSTQYAGTGTAPTITDAGLVGPAGQKAWRIQANRGAGNTSGDYSGPHSDGISVANPHPYIQRLWMKSNTGSTQLVYFYADSGSASTMTVTTEWELFAISDSNLATASSYMWIATRGGSGSTQSIDILACDPYNGATDDPYSSSLFVGDLWVSSTTGEMKRWDGDSWENADGNIRAQWGVALDVNNRIKGRINLDGTNESSTFVVAVDKFVIENATATITAFEIVTGGKIVMGADVQSNNYSAGSAGWRIERTGNAEFNNVTVRGSIYSTAGTIGGFTLASSTLSAGSSGTLVRLSANEYTGLHIGGVAMYSTATSAPSSGGYFLEMPNAILYCPYNYTVGYLELQSSGVTQLKLLGSGSIQIAGTQVLGPQEAAIADLALAGVTYSSDAPDIEDKINTVLAALRSHGLIDT